MGDADGVADEMRAALGEINAYKIFLHVGTTLGMCLKRKPSRVQSMTPPTIEQAVEDESR